MENAIKKAWKHLLCLFIVASLDYKNLNMIHQSKRPQSTREFLSAVNRKFSLSASAYITPSSHSHQPCLVQLNWILEHFTPLLHFVGVGLNPVQDLWCELNNQSAWKRWSWPTNHCKRTIYTSFQILGSEIRGSWHVAVNEMSDGGKMWSYKEQKQLLEISSEQEISQLLGKWHKASTGRRGQRSIQSPHH